MASSSTIKTRQDRSTTYPDLALTRVHKRIVVCCDGTLQDGVIKKHRWQCSNVLKLARSFYKEDRRHHPPVPQIVFYQSGVGSENNPYALIVGGATGEGLVEKVVEAYAFVAHNYCPGDEIFLFGFSRGAYTARMVAEFIGAIGILDNADMDHFAEVFLAYQKRGKTDDPKEHKECNDILAPFVDANARGKRNTSFTGSHFSVKCIGVFDTVGALGLPTELTHRSAKTHIFGFVDRHLGEHVERALHALALNETRKDFEAATFNQSEEGRRKGQILRQCWFPGSHTDIGGGFQYHDLSDLTLTWMAANIEDIISLDPHYLRSHFDGHFAPYGKQMPHDSHYGLFRITQARTRKLPKPDCADTQETVHPSALLQDIPRQDLRSLVEQHPEMEWSLLPFEEEVMKQWSIESNKIVDVERAIFMHTPLFYSQRLSCLIPATEYQTLTVDEEPDVLKSVQREDKMQGSFMHKAKLQAKQFGHVAHELEREARHSSVQTKVMENESGKPLYQKTWLGKLIHDHLHKS